MKSLATLLLLLAATPIFTQEIITYSTTNPNHANDIYGTPCQQIERTPAGGFVVHGGYNSLSDNFGGLQTGAPDLSRFIASYAPDGKIEWVRGVLSAGVPRTRLRVDGSSGDIFFASQFHDSVRVGNVKFLAPYPKSDIAVGRLDAQGNFLGAFTTGADSSYENFYDLEILDDGSLAVLLTTDAKGIFRNFQFPFDPALPISILAARFSPSGDFISALHLGASEYDFGNFGLEILPNGNFAVGGGMYSGGFNFGGQAIQNMMSVAGCWSPSGSLQWLKPIYTTGPECHVFDIAADLSSGDIAFTGQYIGQLLEGSPRDQSVYFFDVLVGKIRGSDGLILWSRNGDDGSNFSEYGNKVEIDAAGNIYIVGNCKGGLVFDGSVGQCNSGPYQQAFLAKFDKSGGYSWGACDGSGIGTDLIVAADKTVWTVGTNAAGVSWENGNFLNHWKNRQLEIAPLAQQKFCTGEKIRLDWTLDGGAFPAGANVEISIRTAEKELLKFLANSLGTASAAGAVEFELPHGIVPPDQIATVAILLTLDYRNSAQTEFITIAQSPVPAVSPKPYPACVGRTGFWIAPSEWYKKPESVEWLPASKFSNFDSTAAQVIIAEPDIFYKVIFRDTTSGCSASDSLKLFVYDWQIDLSGAERVFGVQNLDYKAKILGEKYPPFAYDWSDNLPWFINGPSAYLQIFDTTLVGVTASDWFGCQRSDTILVIYEPARVLRGRVFNRDSVAAMQFTPFEIYQKEKTSGDLRLIGLSLTELDGRFYAEIPATETDTTIWLRIAPDSLIYPLDAPTWFTRKYFAQNAVPISILADTTSLPNIRLLDSQMLPDSNGLISGTIEKLLQKSPDAAASGPAEGLTIWIADANRQPLRYTVTDANGFFRFDNLPFGKFYFLVDRLGVDNSLAPYIVLSAARPAAENLTGTLTAKQFFLPDAVAATEPSVADFRLSPNPFLGKILTAACPQFSNQKLAVELLDAAGRRVFFQKNLQADGSGQVAIELPAGLVAGSYFLKIETSGGGVFLKKLEAVR